MSFHHNYPISRLQTSASQPSRLFKLPVELVYEIAAISNGLERAALASTCQGLRQTVSPLLFSEISLGSLGDLRNAAAASILQYARSLIIRVDSGLLDAFAEGHDYSESLNFNPPVFRYMATILCNTSRLKSFSILLEDNGSNPYMELPVWENYNRYHGTGIRFDKPLDSALGRLLGGMASQRQWQSIEKIHLEGIADVAGFVSRCPSLKELVVKVPSGPCDTTSERLIWALGAVPKLRVLALSISSMSTGARRAPLLEQIAKSSRNLRVLDLMHYAVNTGSGKLEPRGFVCNLEDQDLVARVSLFPHLKSLTLPYLLSRPLGNEGEGGLDSIASGVIPRLAQGIAEGTPRLTQLRWPRQGGRCIGPKDLIELSIERDPDSFEVRSMRAVHANHPNRVSEVRPLDGGDHSATPLTLRDMILRIVGLYGLLLLNLWDGRSFLHNVTQ